MTDTRPTPDDDDLLLDDHLNQLADDEHRRLHERLRVDPQLAARHRRLRRVLEPLDAWTPPPPPHNLVGRILDAMAEQRSGGPVVRESSLSYGGRGGPRFSLHDLLAVAAVITFFFAILFPSMSTVRQRSQRAACASNLSRVGRGVSAYALANSNALPYRPAARRTSFLPGVGDAEYAPNSRSVLLLTRLRLVPARVFICPTDKRRVPLNDIDSAIRGDSSGGHLCSYDSLNMAGVIPSYSMNSRLPYMSDANPLFAGRRFNAVNPAVTNSPAHRKSGQNLLHLNGAVIWCSTPNAGRHHDNIWQAGNITRYNGTEVQKTVNDTFLVP